jgi:hypothetical protein
MAESHTVSGVVFKSAEGKTYFIPHKVMEGFRVDDPAGQKMLDQHISSTATAPLQAHSVAMDRNALLDAKIL